MIRFLARPIVRAFVRSSWPDRLLEAAHGLVRWCGIQRAYLVSDEDGFAQERAVNLMEACWAANAWYEEKRALDPSLPGHAIRRDGPEGWRLTPPEIHVRMGHELARRCRGRSSWV